METAQLTALDGETAYPYGEPRSLSGAPKKEAAL